MSDGRNWGSTVLGWFIVRDESAGDLPGEAQPEAGGMTPDAVPPEPSPAFYRAGAVTPDGRVDFGGVFDAAGITAEERERVAKAGELLASLPAETPVAVRRQIVEASLKAFGVPIDKIIETGVEEIEALEGCIRSGAADTQQLLQESSRRIEQLEAEIGNVRTVMEGRVKEQQALTSACNAKKLEVQRVLEFFGQETVARVVRESPKLHEPTAPDPSTT